MSEKKSIVLAELVTSGVAIGLSVIDRFLNASSHPIAQRVRDLRPPRWPTEIAAEEIEHQKRGVEP